MRLFKTTIFIATSLFIFSCTSNQTPISATGADKDPNGCITSAGYSWSKIKKDCIRVFELPLQLENVDKTYSAGVIISEDTKEAEVLTKDGDYILTKQSENSYINASDKGGVFLKKIDNKWTFGKIKDDSIEYTEISK